MGMELAIRVRKQLHVRGRIVSNPLCTLGDPNIADIMNWSKNSIILRLQSIRKRACYK